MAASTQVSKGEQSSRSHAGMESTTRLRGVRAVRLSVLTDETTSPERQRDACEGAAAALGIDLDGREAVDLDVSASKTTPWDRPEFGAWLHRPDEYDAIVWWRSDRAVRSQGDMHELAPRRARTAPSGATGDAGRPLGAPYRQPRRGR